MEVLIRLEKNWRLSLFKSYFLLQLDFGFLSVLCLPPISALKINVAWHRDSLRFYLVVGTIQRISFSYCIFDVSCLLPSFCLEFHTERWPTISPSLGLPLPTSLKYFHMTLNPTSLFKICLLTSDLSCLLWAPSCHEKHINIVQTWCGEAASGLAKEKIKKTVPQCMSQN